MSAGGAEGEIRHAPGAFTGIITVDEWVKMRGDRSLSGIVQAMLAIDPEDTSVQYYAAIWSDSPSNAKSYLKKMEGTKTDSTAAFSIAMKINDLKLVLDGQDAGSAADWAGNLGTMFHFLFPSGEAMLVLGYI